MGFLSWLATGLVVGVLVKLTYGLRGAGDWLACPLLGMAGGALGGLVFLMFRWGALQEFHVGSVVVAGLVATLVLIGYRVAQRQPRWS